ncbi:MAG: T9SS type A sorting domain-containing protein [Bacteroidales bacterium]
MKQLITTALLLIASLHLQSQSPIAVNDTFDIFLMDDTVTFNLVKNDISQSGNPFYLYQALGSISHTDSTATYYLPYLTHFKKSGVVFYKNYTILDTTNGQQLVGTGAVYFNFHNHYFDTLDINNVSARINNNGNHFWNLVNQNHYKVPKWLDEDAIFCYSTWIGGLDVNGQLHLAADRYSDGQDFFPGPVSFGNVYNNIYDSAWNRVWKINKTDIDYHKSHWWITGYQAPEVILKWPGNGNTLLGQADQLAPFYDLANNGIYEPMAGDYPLIKGDQAVFFIQNDARRLHTATQGSNMGIEIHGMAYAFNCPEDSALMYTTFLHYDIYNRSTMTYHDTYMGVFVDTDLGYAWDDYVGCDIPRNSFYTYNGGLVSSKSIALSTTLLAGPYMDPDNIDNPNTDAFGNPLCDLSINGLHFDDGIIDNERFGMNSFVYFSNCASGPTCDPNNAAEYFGLLRCIWKDGVHMKYGGNGHPNSGSTMTDCRFMFPDLSDFCNWGTDGVQPPGYMTGAGGAGLIWNEEGVGNPPDDRRGVMSFGPFNFNPGQKQELDVAFVYGRDWVDTSLWSGIVSLNNRIDQIHNYFRLDTTPCGGTFTAIKKPYANPKTLKLYPVPSDNELNIEFENTSGKAKYTILGLAGNTVSAGSLQNRNVNRISLANLKPGIYLFVIKDGNNLLNQKFIKN